MTPRIWPGWRVSRRSRRAGRPRRSTSRESVAHRARQTTCVRLNAYLARAGVASRRKADELIKAGRVTVNGEPGAAEHLRPVATTSSRSTAEPVAKQPLAYVLLHKPAGVVTTASDPQGGRPSSGSSTTTRASSPSAGSTSTRPAPCCSRTTGRSRTGSPTPLRRREGVRGRDLEGADDEALRRSPTASSSRTTSTAPAACRRLGAAASSSSSTKAATARCGGCSRRSATACGGCTAPVYAGLGLDGLDPGRVARAHARARSRGSRSTCLLRRRSPSPRTSARASAPTPPRLLRLRQPAAAAARPRPPAARGSAPGSARPPRRPPRRRPS